MKAKLEKIRKSVSVSERMQLDPLGVVSRSDSVQRIELTAFMAAGLAFGNVKAIRQSVNRVAAAFDCLDTLKQGHRWVTAPDIVVVINRLMELQSGYGSLGRAFTNGYVKGDMRASMSAFSALLRDGLPMTRGVGYLTSSPDNGSACKRMNLFMRWMVRQSEPDLGLWSEVSAGDLIAPMDVHVIRFAKLNGLTTRSTINWKMAADVTSAFRQICPDDPLRYDFAISHYGMMHGWQSAL